MIINGIEFEFDFYDTRNIKKYELATEKLNNVLKDPNLVNKKQYEQAEIYCQTIIDFVHDIFDQEIADKLINNPNNMIECIEVLAQITNEGNKLVNETEKVISKYSLSRLNESK